MTKISLIDRASSIRVSTPSLTPAAARPRPVAVDILDKSHLYLVPSPRRETPQPRLSPGRLLREHPFLIDAGFVTMTLGVATLLWWCGW